MESAYECAPDVRNDTLGIAYHPKKTNWVVG